MKKDNSIIDLSKKGTSQLLEGINSTFGELTLDFAHKLRLIEMNLKEVEKPHIFFQLLKNFFQVVTGTDPNKFHFDVARKALEAIQDDSSLNDAAIDMLARELLKACNELNQKFTLPPKLMSLLKDCNCLLKNNTAKEGLLPFAFCPINDAFVCFFFNCIRPRKIQVII